MERCFASPIFYNLYYPTSLFVFRTRIPIGGLVRACEICTHYVGVLPTWTSGPHINGVKDSPYHTSRLSWPAVFAIPFSYLPLYIWLSYFRNLKLLGTGAGGHLLSAPTGSWGFKVTPAIQPYLATTDRPALHLSVLGLAMERMSSIIHTTVLVIFVANF